MHSGTLIERGRNPEREREQELDLGVDTAGEREFRTEIRGK